MAWGSWSWSLFFPKFSTHSAHPAALPRSWTVTCHLEWSLICLHSFWKFALYLRNMLSRDLMPKVLRVLVPNHLDQWQCLSLSLSLCPAWPIQFFIFASTADRLSFDLCFGFSAPFVLKCLQMNCCLACYTFSQDLRFFRLLFLFSLVFLWVGSPTKWLEWVALPAVFELVGCKTFQLNGLTLRCEAITCRQPNQPSTRLICMRLKLKGGVAFKSPKKKGSHALEILKSS